MVVQAAMLKDAILRKSDADFDNEVPISEAYEPLSSVEVAGLKLENQVIYDLETKLGFKIGKNDKSTLAREGFYDLLRSYGVEKLPNKIEYNAMPEREKNVLKLKLNMAVQQMQFVMSDIYVYVNKGKISKNDVVNQLLQSYPEITE
tara:strand:- start:76 stop:516 length:441 start_codon:yes stop_codon:yes gene_type:complete